MATRMRIEFKKAYDCIDGVFAIYINGHRHTNEDGEESMIRIGEGVPYRRPDGVYLLWLFLYYGNEGHFISNCIPYKNGEEEKAFKVARAIVRQTLESVK